VKYIFVLLILFSVGIMGQSKKLSPLDVTNPVKVTKAPVKVYDSNTKNWYINPCLNNNPCIFTGNSTCVYDGEGQSHCECNEGYTKSSNGQCLSYCHEDVNPCTSNTICVENIEDKAICLDRNSSIFWDNCGNKNSASCGGVLLCKEYDLNGECKIVRSDYSGMSVKVYKSAKALNNWEVFACPDISSIFIDCEKIDTNRTYDNLAQINHKAEDWEDNEVVDHKIIDNEFNRLVNQNGDKYYKAYYKENGQCRPAIYDISKADIEIVKVY
jgi:hypothetical protein